MSVDKCVVWENLLQIEEEQIYSRDDNSSKIIRENQMSWNDFYTNNLWTVIMPLPLRGSSFNANGRTYIYTLNDVGSKNVVQ